VDARRVRAFLRRHGLTLTLLVLFVGSAIGQALTGWIDDAKTTLAEGEDARTLASYLRSGHFLEALAENWESEFLQMALFVILTALLYEKGSPESNDPDDPPPKEDFARARSDPRAPWPVRRGGVALTLYRNSLGLTLLLLFAVAFVLHVRFGMAAWNDERVAQHQQPVGAVAYLHSSRFWFESFQNWQSEFLSVAAMVWLAVYLRQDGSAQSKPVAAPHDEHGD
jgi:hypothetical protein